MARDIQHHKPCTFRYTTILQDPRSIFDSSCAFVHTALKLRHPRSFWSSSRLRRLLNDIARMESGVAIYPQYNVMPRPDYSQKNCPSPLASTESGLNALKRAASELRWMQNETDSDSPLEKRLRTDQVNRGQMSSPGSSSEKGSSRNLPPIVRGKKGVVWTPELHQRFVDAINNLGMEHSCPKKILRMMDVPGLTRENVSSHLQKYRIKLISDQKGGNPIDMSGTESPRPSQQGSGSEQDKPSSRSSSPAASQRGSSSPQSLPSRSPRGSSSPSPTIADSIVSSSSKGSSSDEGGSTRERPPAQQRVSSKLEARNLDRHNSRNDADLLASIRNGNHITSPDSRTNSSNSWSTLTSSHGSDRERTTKVSRPSSPLRNNNNSNSNNNNSNSNSISHPKHDRRSPQPSSLDAPPTNNVFFSASNSPAPVRASPRSSSHTTTTVVRNPSPVSFESMAEGFKRSSSLEALSTAALSSAAVFRPKAPEVTTSQLSEFVLESQRHESLQRPTAADVSRLSLNERYKIAPEMNHMFEYMKMIYSEYWPQRFSFSPLFTTRWDWNQLLVSVHSLLSELSSVNSIADQEVYKTLLSKKDELNMYLTGVCRNQSQTNNNNNIESFGT
eukprot:CAMPEP_0184346924 /NCGR_PEP_ID=MMETSP1089-20130417/15104_1 /TAXON_ID=38269 ORGANISM="Gloeochaete wittrockiana, Strain SAG46.84" /NCGR_SAMPLE_ID=MMETSP1089 /ASSEMBLY_ACC=CAM_ASM_000445 /LENGTH=615 /DNA_ID=CAMNT_0026677793 /DNA_START=27 /DNA_END=1874 /DNA_ORIENTATION=-